jgi:hypothetical protein
VPELKGAFDVVLVKYVGHLREVRDVFVVVRCEATHEVSLYLREPDDG